MLSSFNDLVVRSKTEVIQKFCCSALQNMIEIILRRVWDAVLVIYLDIL